MKNNYDSLQEIQLKNWWYFCVHHSRLNLMAETLFPFVTLDGQCSFPSTLVPFRHQGDKSIWRKWRDNEEIMWENSTDSHQLLKRRRRRLEELLVEGWTGQVSMKLTGTEEENAAAGRREGRGKHGGMRGWVSSWKRLISAVWNKTHSSGDEHGFQLHVCACIMLTTQITLVPHDYVCRHSYLTAYLPRNAFQSCSK